MRAYVPVLSAPPPDHENSPTAVPGRKRARRPELLAPAGDMECMRAAVANGADAIYFGLQEFNARHRADNFTLEQLPEVMRYLHAHNVKGFITFNTLIFSNELSHAAELLAGIARAGADAIIVQDIGIVRLARAIAPGLAIHASTQMTLTEPRGIAFAENLGVSRVVLARELSVADITKIRQACAMPLEVFIHGALCVAYSGQCMTSEALGGRSANRGQCAQACRLPYDLIVDDQRRDLGDVAYLLSPRDLAAWDMVRELAAQGVMSLKIEGRLKNAAYVAAATQTYRAALDAVGDDAPFHAGPEQELALAQTFSRGFSHGFLDGVNHQKLVNGSYSKSRGLPVGVVDKVLPDLIVIRTSRPASLIPGATPLPVELKAGDGVVFVPAASHALTATVGAPPGPGGRIHGVTVRPDGKVALRFAPAQLAAGAVLVGASVWKTDDPALRRRLEQTFSRDVVARRKLLNIVVRGTVGQGLEIVVTGPQAQRVSVQWKGPLQEAVKNPLTEAMIREQFGRLGDTPYALGEVFLEGGAPGAALPVYVPKSVMNDLRRQAIVALAEAAPPAPAVHAEALEQLRAALPTRPVPLKDAASPGLLATPQLCILVRRLDQLRAILAWQPPMPSLRPVIIYCDFEDIRVSREGVTLCRQAGIAGGLATVRIVKPGEDGLLRILLEAEPDAILARNHAAISFFREQAPQLPMVADHSLNIVNELSAEAFMQLGLRRITPGYDMNIGQLLELARRLDGQTCEIVLHQHMPMFHMEHCVFAHTLSDGKDYRDCGRPCESHRVSLRDRMGVDHALLADTGCRNTVFNGTAQSAAYYLPEMRQAGLNLFRVELLREDGAAAVAVVDRYARLLAGQDDPRRGGDALRVLTQFGVTRGTLGFE